jgi:uncharacterized protein (DUF433 family)
MAQLDWSQCPAVESIPGKVSGAWVLRDTRMPVAVIFENLEYGATIEEIIENYNVTREEIQAVLEFAAQSAAPPPGPPATPGQADARTL